MNELEIRRGDVAESNIAHKNHLKSLIDFLLSEVLSAGGDGDAFWVVKNYTLESVREFVLDFCLTDTDKRYWSVGEIVTDKYGKRFSLSNHQEALIITTAAEYIPLWAQCVVTL